MRLPERSLSPTALRRYVGRHRAPEAVAPVHSARLATPQLAPACRRRQLAARPADLPARHGGRHRARRRTPCSTSAMSSSSRPCTHSTSALSSEASPSPTVPWPSSRQARSAVGKNSPVAARLGQAVGEEQQPVAGLEPLDPRPHHRHEAERRRRGRRLQRDHLAAPQQQRRRVPAVDDRERAAALLDQRRGDEVLVADAAGHRPVQVGDDRAQVGPLVGDVPVASRARCWPGAPRRGPCPARRR